MLKDLNYLTLKENGLIPSDTIELKKETNQNLVVFSERELVNSSVEDFGIVTDDFKWIAYSKSTGIVYSSDGKFIYGYYHISDEEGEYIKYLPKDRLIPINKNKIFRRNGEMSTNSQEIKERIANLQKQQAAKGTTNTTTIPDSAAFTGNKGTSDEEAKLKAAEQNAKMEDLSKAIKTLSGGVDLKDVSDLYNFNQPRSSLIGWITDRDARLHAKAESKPIPDPVTGKPKLKENVPQDVRDLVAQGKRPAREFLLESTKIKVNEMAPGAAKFAIVQMPVEGIVPMNKLRDPEFKLELDPKSNGTKVIKFYNKKEFVATVISLLGGSIQEDARTNAEPSIINAFLKAKPVQDKTTGRTENKLTPSITVASKRKLITASNYFPKTTFATLKLDELTTPEKIDEANLSLFGHLFRSVAGNPTPFSKLDADEKMKIQQDESGKISSKFFDPKERLPLDVKSVFTGAVIASPAIPLKQELPTQDKKSTRLVPVTFDVTRSVEDPYGINPFNDPRFKKIIDACGGELTKEVITGLYAKSKRTKKATVASGIILSPEDATKAYLNAGALDEDGTNKALKGIQFNDALSHDELRNYNDDALKTLNSFFASK